MPPRGFSKRRMISSGRQHFASAGRPIAADEVQAVDEEKSHHPVFLMCRAVPLSRSASRFGSGILASMGDRYAARQCVTEPVMASIKKDRVHRRRFKRRDEARSEIFDYIEGFYNLHRRHSSLGNLSPAEFERSLQQRQLQAAAS